MTRPLDEPVARVTRGGFTESTHLAHVVVTTLDGPPAVVAGDATAAVLPRSALKPLQAIAIVDQLREHGHALSTSQLAIACASHAGGDDHQVEAASVLAEAGLDEGALRCPAEWPEDEHVRSALDAPTSLSHNCSGKHAAMLWAHIAAGGDPVTYLDPDAPLQQRIAAVLARWLGEVPTGPAVDGCGAPAWRCSLHALARASAVLVAGEHPDVAAIRDAMRAHPDLVGGAAMPDTRLMLADARVVAKRGAEGVMTCGFAHPDRGPVGVAVKVLDGAERAAGPIAAAVVAGLGGDVPASLRRPDVLGGGRPQGHVEVADRIAEQVADRVAEPRC